MCIGRSGGNFICETGFWAVVEGNSQATNYFVHVISLDTMILYLLKSFEVANKGRQEYCQSRSIPPDMCQGFIYHLQDRAKQVFGDCPH